jgi:hypothetical protein
MNKHTPRPWIWGDGWEDIDKIGTVYHNDGENPSIEKYMDLQLYGKVGPIIPIRIDHFEVIYDGDPINKADRRLIEAAPDLLLACQSALYPLRAFFNDDPNELTIRMLKSAIAKATGVR